MSAQIGRRRIRPSAASLAALAALAAASPGLAAGHTYRITIAQLAYGAPPSGLVVGDTIEWVNQDILRHTATARDGAFDVDLPPNARARTPLRRAGVLNVFCRYHPGMTARLVVGP